MGDDGKCRFSFAPGHECWASESKENDVEETRTTEQHVRNDGVCERDILVVECAEANDCYGEHSERIYERVAVVTSQRCTHVEEDYDIQKHLHRNTIYALAARG